MDLKKASKQAYEIAIKRGIHEDTIQALKHCAGEVIEAAESYTKFVYSPREEKDTFPEEIADIVTCILSICGAENIDLEKALKDVFEKNRRREENDCNKSVEF